jgi:hypothetical protein
MHIAGSGNGCGFSNKAHADIASACGIATHSALANKTVVMQERFATSTIIAATFSLSDVRSI